MFRKHVLLATSLLLVAAPLAATSGLASEGQPNVVVDVTAMKEVVHRDAAGRESVRLEPTESTGPGDTLVYRIVYTNQGTAAAHEAVVVDPIPAGTSLIPRSWDAAGAAFSVSADGGKSFEPYPVRRPMRQADGATVMREIALSDYTHVRWSDSEPLPPGAARSAVFKVKVR